MKSPFLIGIEKDISKLGTTKYHKAILQLEEENGDSISSDELALNNLMLFFDEKFGLPNGLYRGEDEDEINHFFIEKIRLLKKSLLEYCKGKENNILFESITEVSMHTIIDHLCKVTGVDDFSIKIYLHSVYIIGKRHLFNSFCEALKN